MGYTVKAVADVAGISVRTLHHYDRIGLLRPAANTPAGYRLYSQADLERLQQVLFFRELGFSLQDVKAIVDNPTFDRVAALRAHRRLLVEQQGRLGRLVELVDRTIASIERGEPMSNQERFAAFDYANMRRGKVRDVYDLGDKVLLVASDRLSAFDVVLPTPIPDKGAVLTQLSAFWFGKTADLVGNHMLSADPYPDDPALRGRAMLCRKAERLDVECLARGYLTGSVWAEYSRTGT
ncbi:MAG TPA: phosphoribosylaminoimidazolesuccinocarboxamide synthase, partial [Chloroflexota bacterium]|nr:phosphoribosylaminoimidazolesuccinocarboxamide synthase [Chloroflexota bacterium]